ncbi:MAG: ATP-binding protein [Candidatus Diapherotrites archaeon]|nr:ATP-binding protein [Candidatus Diapherotrites archaeon]
MNEEVVLKQLYLWNDWWVNGSVPKNKLETFQRRDLVYIKEKLEKTKILAIVGPRQVGKTTLMYQSIDFLLKELKVNPANILFVNMDDLLLRLNTDNFLEDILRVYFENILKKPAKDAEKTVFLFFDEIQALDNWNSQLKNWYDQKFNLKFVISGSSSTNILEGSKESLAGRMDPQLVFPLKFLEVNRYNEVAEKGFIDSVNWALRDALRQSIAKKTPKHLFDELKKQKLQLIPFEQKIQINLNTYFIRGGYPGLLKNKKTSEVESDLDNYIQATIYRDIVQLYDVRSPKKLNALITLIAQTGVKTTSYANLAHDLQIRSETLESYLSYLESAFLISEAEFYSKSINVRQRNPKKIYFNDPGIRNSLLSQVNDALLKDSTELGLIAETVAFDHTRRLAFTQSEFKNSNLSYWKKNGEIDIILESIKKCIPIEVKYSSDIKRKTIEEVNQFVEKYDCPFGLILTKDTLELKGKTILVPLWMYLLIC